MRLKNNTLMSPEKGNTEAMEFKVGVYRHFKGGMYLALMLGKDSKVEVESIRNIQSLLILF